MLRRFQPGWRRQTAHLPADFRPRIADQLVRLGSLGDGGYVVDQQSVIQSTFLLSGGVNTDWSFEQAFVEAKDVPLVAFDASVGADVFARRIGKWHFGLKPKVDYQRVLSSYQDFFQGSRRHIKSFIGNVSKPGMTDINGILERELAVFPGRGFFKLDIEGSEYEVLDQLVLQAGRMTGLVVEFHDVQRNLAAIRDFVRRMPLAICHVHINNWGPLSREGVPSVAEISFSRYCGSGFVDGVWPINLDRPCCDSAPDFQLVFDQP